MRRKGKYTEGPWSNENLSHKVGGRVEAGVRNRLRKRETHTEQMRWRAWQSQRQESKKKKETERETEGETERQDKQRGRRGKRPTNKQKWRRDRMDERGDD